MTSGENFLYRDTMKRAEELYKSLGLSLFLFPLIFAAARDYVFVPLIGKVWGLALAGTPEGFICDANILDALTKSPWVFLIGAALVVIYAILAMWQVTSIVIGISYVRQGQKIRLFELLRLSVRHAAEGIRGKNLMILLYSLIIVPLADIYQTNDLINRIVIPEYIQDFINSKVVLLVIFIALLLLAGYIALRWVFLLPSFILKNSDFKEARTESDSLTARCWLKTGINLSLYSILQFIKKSLFPLAVIMLPVFVCYCLTSHIALSSGLYRVIGISMGLEIVQSITGALVQLCVMCFLVELYYERLERNGAATLPELAALNAEDRSRLTPRNFCIIACAAYSALLAVMYLGTVLVSRSNEDVILDIFGRTEIIAHKGYSSRAPENTMPAFGLADKSDAVTYIELDVWTSKDGIPVVIHNETIADATGLDRNIYDCTYEELQNIPAPYAMSPEDFPDARIPSLEEVIKSYAHSTPLLIEIKGFKQDPQLPGKIVELMKKYGCERTSLIHSGNYEALKAVKEADTDIRCGLILAIVTGNYYDLPYVDFFSVEHSFIDETTVSQLHRRGKDIYAWTVNYSDSAEELKFTGVDGIITDYPDDMTEYVADKNDMVETALKKKLTNLFNKDAKKIAEQVFNEGMY